MNGLLAILIAYFLGAIPVGFLLVKLTSGKDVRAWGSGNIGATNVLRIGGRKAAIVTLVLDMVKGFAAVWIAAELTNSSFLWESASALAVMAGHAFPVFLRFRGGKAVATFIGAFMYLTPLPMVAALTLFGIIAAATRYISAASIVAAGSFPLGVWLILHPSNDVLLASLIAGAFVVYRHKSNIRRIRAGVEDTFRWNRQ